MSLDIPDEALHTGWSEYRYPRPAVDEPSDRFKRGLAAAVPLAFAAELDRLAGQTEKEILCPCMGRVKGDS